MILVTGGTGFLGAHLLCKLVAQEACVRAIYRDASKFETVKKICAYYSESPDVLFDKIEWVKADVTDVPALEIAFQDITHVYHCAADLSFMPKNYKLSRAVNVTGTANIVNLCLRNTVHKLCHVSSIATLGEATKGVITETTRWNWEKNKQNIYAITKYDAELEVWRGTQEGLNVVIVNPGVILGPGFWDSGTGEIFKKAAKGFSYFTSGNVGVVDASDVANAMISLAKSEIVNEQFIVVSENISYKKMMQTVLESLNKTNKLKELKRWQLLVLLQFDIFFSLIFKTKRRLFRANINSVFKTLNYDASKIKLAIDMEFMSATESIQKTAKLFQQE